MKQHSVDNEYRFREAWASDVPALKKIRDSVVENALQRGTIELDAYEKALFKDGKGWVCELAGDLIGFSCGRPEKRDVWALFIKKEHEGRGIGNRLMELLETWMFSRGCPFIQLSTEPETRAERLYRRRGWQPGGMSPHGDREFRLSPRGHLPMREGIDAISEIAEVQQQAPDSAGVENPFEIPAGAGRYHQFRPDHHSIPLKWVVSKQTGAVKRALDVACGTGKSSDAMSKLCDSVVGCDKSSAMLAEARRHSKLEFMESSAERLRFEDEKFDWVNVSMGIHWFDQRLFLSEAKRVLREGGYLSIDNYGFSGKMIENPNFQAFNDSFYREKFPKPRRNADYPIDEIIRGCGFNLEGEFSYDHGIAMTLHEFVGYTLTQSNVLVQTAISSDEVPTILERAYAPFFQGERQKLIFSGLVKLYRRI